MYMYFEINNVGQKKKKEEKIQEKKIYFYGKVILLIYSFHSRIKTNFR